MCCIPGFSSRVRENKSVLSPGLTLGSTEDGEEPLLYLVEPNLAGWTIALPRHGLVTHIQPIFGQRLMGSVVGDDWTGVSLRQVGGSDVEWCAEVVCAVELSDLASA